VTEDDQQLAGTLFVRWLERQVIADARGDDISQLTEKPADRLWLGRLAPEDAAWKSGMGERGQRLDPCSAGFRFRPATAPPWSWTAHVAFRVWTHPKPAEGGESLWVKSELIRVDVPINVKEFALTTVSFGSDEFAVALGDHRETHDLRVDVQMDVEQDGISVAVVVVNQSLEKRGHDTNVYEATLEVDVGETEPFLLDALPDSFRYNRLLPAYGINGGVGVDGDRRLRTLDVISEERRRPQYWDDSIGPEPDLRFMQLSTDPLVTLDELVDALERWREREWSRTRLDARQVSEGWSDEMRVQADLEAEKAAAEVARCRRGLELIRSRDDVRRAFELMNEAFVHSGEGHYDRWRPFQLGFLLAALPSLVDESLPEREVVDTLWFATGGGKTETYLAIVVFTCLFDRMRGKKHGVSVWSRFPLRMLSLQQTQRFADALAGAELARRREGIVGDSFALGFLVGKGGTPNKIRDDASPGDTNATDPDMPDRNQVLLRCPFCRRPDLKMRFDRKYWLLQHCCPHDDCPWKDDALPFYVVDEEIYRLLPCVVVGTLDKAASVSMQAAMRGLYASPFNLCKGDRHGFTYAPRSKTPHGCLVPGCTFGPAALPQPRELFPPSVRIQDELHLLRGGLGAIDAHYETLLDHLHRSTGSAVPKDIASSATLAGYEEQVAVLYKREGTVFPLPGPEQGISFWTKDQELLARRFTGLAPRGVTLEFANDRIAESLQRAVRRLLDDRVATCAEIGIDPALATFILDYYGTNVVYGNTLRDINAAVRSFDGQPGVQPLNVATLTGGTPLEEVREVLGRLDSPEIEFLERIHIICASSMMSHGVDIDRFNSITVLGVPLTTAEVIQTTARIGRRFPGLVLLLHRMGVERDASVFRTFDIYVRQGDRFVEPIAVTRKSRRVLNHTFPGMFAARILGVHEPSSVFSGGKQLTMVKPLKKYFQERPVTEDDELGSICDALGIDSSDLEDPLVIELTKLMRETWRVLNDPATTVKFPNELTPRPPMTSLRAVEMTVPIKVIEKGSA
jgi:hypothetical protein